MYIIKNNKYLVKSKSDVSLAIKSYNNKFKISMDILDLLVNKRTIGYNLMRLYIIITKCYLNTNEII